MFYLKSRAWSITSSILTVLSLIVLILFTTATIAYSSYEYSQIDYYLNTDGSTTVRIVLKNVNATNITLTLEGRPIPETIVAQDAYGMPLTTELRGNTLVIEVFGNVSEVRVSYVTINSINVSEGVVKYVLNPPTLSNIYIPSNMALVDFTDEPDISLTNSYIVLTYKQKGTYTVTIALIPQAITATLTTATTPTTVKTSPETWTTLTSTTQVPQTTTATTLTTYTYVTSTTTTPTAGGQNTTLILIAVVVVAVVALLTYSFLRRR